MKENTLNTPSLLFNLHEVLVRDDEVVLCVESFLFLGIKMIFLTIVQPFTEGEDLSWGKMVALVCYAKDL